MIKLINQHFKLINPNLLLVMFTFEYVQAVGTKIKGGNNQGHRSCSKYGFTHFPEFSYNFICFRLIFDLSFLV